MVKIQKYYDANSFIMLLVLLYVEFRTESQYHKLEKIIISLQNLIHQHFRK